MNTRNKPCSCGSGKKTKKCCAIPKQQATMAMIPPAYTGDGADETVTSKNARANIRGQHQAMMMMAMLVGMAQLEANGPRR